jgi:hypothetical protein
MPKTRPFCIICVDSCLSALLGRGILPDLVIILESQHWNLESFIGLQNMKISAVIDLSALPRSGTVLADGLFLFFTPWAKLSIFKRLGAAGLLPFSLPPMGSVGLSAVAIARQLSSGTIISAGLDFSFTLDSYHARSTPGHLSRLRRQNRFKGILNAEAAFGHAIFSTASKNGSRVFSSPAMRNYCELFRREFAADPGLFDLAGSGLPLGIKTLPLETAFNLLCCKTQTVMDTNETSFIRGEKLRIFIQNEQSRLGLLLKMLTSAVPIDYTALETLIEECDYLWAHFPDYAAAARCPDRAELETRDFYVVSFLKRLRTEIDPVMKLWELTLKEVVI